MSTLGALIEELSHLDPGAQALEFEGQWWSWADLTRIGTALEEKLAAAGLGENARIAGLLRNSPEAAGAIISVMSSNRCLVTLNPSLPDDALAADIAALRPGAVFGLERDWARPGLLQVMNDIGSLALVLTGNRSEPVALLGEARRPAFDTIEAFADDDVGLEMLTSGTTGTPKRIPLTRHAIELSVLSAAVFDGRKPGEPAKLRDQKVMLSAPFTHLAGIFGLFNAIMGGRKVVLLPRFTVDGWVGAVERHAMKVASAPPAALRMIFDAGVEKTRLRSLAAFRTGTAPLDPDLADAFQQRYGIPVLQNYSATEFAGAGAGWTLADHKQFYPAKRGSVGRMNPGIEARIVAVEDHTPLPSGEQGLLEIRAPHLQGGEWIRTTDLAILDDDGFLFIKGRADNAIIRGGFKVFPEAIVAALEKHPAILEASVVGLPDERLGQVPVAAYLLKAGASPLGEAEMDAFLRGSLMPYQIPVRIVHLEQMPRTPSLKVSQPALRALLDTMMREAAST